MGAASPNDVADLCQAARQHLQDGNLAAAVDELRRAAGMDPDNAEAYGLLGIATTRQGDVDGGLRAFERAVQLDPRSADRRYNHAIALEKAGKTDAAIAELKEGLGIQPGHVKTREALGRLCADVLAAPAEPAKPAHTPAFDLPTSPAPPPPASAMAPGGVAPSQAQAMYQQPAAYAAPPPQAQAAYPQQAAYGQQPGYGQQQPAYGQQAAYGQPAAPYRPVYGMRHGANEPVVQADGPDPGFWTFEHVTQILMEPSTFFAEQKGYTNFWPPIAFMLVHLPGVVLSMIVIVLLRLMANGMQSSYSTGEIIGRLLGFFLGMVVGAMPAVIVAQFAVAGVLHLFALMFKPAGGYPGTFRVSVYASVPVAVTVLAGVLLAALIPTGASAASGSLMLLGGLWGLWILAVGLSEVHEFSPGKGIIVGLLSSIVVAGLAVLVGLVMGRMSTLPYSLGGPSFGAPSSSFGGPTFGGPSPSFGGPPVVVPDMSTRPLPGMQPPSMPTMPSMPHAMPPSMPMTPPTIRQPSMPSMPRTGPSGPSMQSQMDSMHSRMNQMQSEMRSRMDAMRAQTRSRMGPMGPGGPRSFGGP